MYALFIFYKCLLLMIIHEYYVLMITIFQILRKVTFEIQWETFEAWSRFRLQINSIFHFKLCAVSLYFILVSKFPCFIVYLNPPKDVFSQLLTGDWRCVTWPPPSCWVLPAWKQKHAFWTIFQIFYFPPILVMKSFISIIWSISHQNYGYFKLLCQ